MWQLLLRARKAYREWQSLSAKDRAHLKDQANRVRSLVIELLGPRAASFLDGADGRVDDQQETTCSGRAHSAILAELKDATAALAADLSTFTRAAALGRLPRSIRLSATVAGFGARRTANRFLANRALGERGTMSNAKDSADDGIGVDEESIAGNAGSDGGLREARAKLETRTRELTEQGRADRRAVEAALRDQRIRLEAAIAAFEVELDTLKVPPEEVFVGTKTIGSDPRPRFRKHPTRGWGFHADPTPAEPVYDKRYTLYQWSTPLADKTVGQSVVLRRPQAVSFVDTTGHNHNLWGNLPAGFLSFHVDADDTLVEGSTCGGDVNRQIDSITKTADWLVDRLATYLNKADGRSQQA